MAQKSIDLLQPDKISLVEEKRSFYLKLGTIFLVIIYCLVVVVIFSFGLLVRWEYQIVTKGVEQTIIKLNDLREVESLQMLLKQRLSYSMEIVTRERLDPKYWLKYIDSLVPEGVALEEVQWSYGGLVNLSGMAGNALYLSDFLNNIKEAADEEKFSQGTLVSATRHPEGTYTFNLEVLIKGDEDARQ